MRCQPVVWLRNLGNSSTAVASGRITNSKAGYLQAKADPAKNPIQPMAWFSDPDTLAVPVGGCGETGWCTATTIQIAAAKKQATADSIKPSAAPSIMAGIASVMATVQIPVTRLDRRVTAQPMIVAVNRAKQANTTLPDKAPHHHGCAAEVSRHQSIVAKACISAPIG